MSGYILCQVKRAKNPYYISNISTNIYSIEELCYYLYHNIYLLDETIINEQLLVWMKEELHLRRLYQRLYVLLEEKKNIGEFILPIFKEINYLSHDQFREMNERLKRFEEQPEIVRKKIKGDYLVDHARVRIQDRRRSCRLPAYIRCGSDALHASAADPAPPDQWNFQYQ